MKGDLEITQLELKYCERCGRLWLRRRETGEVYCEACTSEIPYFPLCGRRIIRPRLVIDVQAGIEGQDGAMQSAAIERGGLA